MDRKKLETILVLVVACIIGYFLLKKPYFLTAGLVLGAIGIFIPFLAGLIHRGWTWLGHGIGFVMGRILLCLIFYIFLVPVSLASKVFRRKDVVRLKRGGNSNFTERSLFYTKESMEHTW